MTFNKSTIYGAIPIALSAGIGTAVAIFSDVIQKLEIQLSYKLRKGSWLYVEHRFV
jgi:hypothetical protein